MGPGFAGWVQSLVWLCSPWPLWERGWQRERGDGVVRGHAQLVRGSAVTRQHGAGLLALLRLRVGGCVAVTAAGSGGTAAGLAEHP